MTPRTLRIALSVFCLIAAMIHIIRPDIAIDGITVSLILTALLPWLGAIFKAVELPGGIKIEYAALEKVELEAQSAGALSTPREGPVAARQIMATSDPNLALAGLRIELERRLREIGEKSGTPNKRRGLRQLMDELQRRNLLAPEQASVLKDLIPILNAAVHGAQVDPRASSWASEVGPQLLAGLEVPSAVDIPALLVRWRRADGAEVMEVGEELSKAAIQLPHEFLRLMGDSPSDLERWLEDLSYHSFTVFRGADKLETDFYSAYYERFRSRLLKAMQAYAADPAYGEIAQRIATVVEKVQIRTID